MKNFSSRDVVLEALKQARVSGTISRWDYFSARVTSRIARSKFDRLCDDIVKTATESVEGSEAGLYGDLDQFENILKLILEYIPQILALVKTIISLFSSDD